MKRKYVILSIVIFVIFLFSGITVYAYFSNNTSFNHNVSYDIPDGYVQINTLNEFYNEIDLYKDNLSNDFNDSSLVSKTRKTLILNVDLTLTADAIVTSDCHINLNGHKLDLNGFKFNIKNTYAGTIAIFSTSVSKSVITDSIGANEIIIDTPNACFIVDNVHVDSTIDVVKNAVSDEAVINSAIKMIYANISNGGVNDLYSTTKVLNKAFMDPKKCAFMGHADDSNTIGCVYTYTDLDLLTSFYNYDVFITYTSSNEATLKPSGRVIVGVTSDLSILGVTVSYNGKSITKNINVHTIIESDYQKASNIALLTYLENFYDNNLGKYKFSNGFNLPLKNEYFKSNYDYILKEGKTEYTSDIKDYFILNQDDVTIKIKKNITSIVIKSTGVNTYTNEISVSGETNTVIDDDYSYCLGIINGEYNNQIIIKEFKENNVIKYTSQKLLKTTDPIKHSRLKEGSIILNELKSNSDKTYQITPDNEDYDLLSVNPNSKVNPYIGQGVYMAFTFTMKDNTEVVIQLPIIFEPLKDTGESGFQLFLPYYNFFSKKFDYNSKFERSYVEFEEHWYDSFSMPLFYNNEYPTYTFIIYERDGNGFKMVDESLGLFKVQITLPDGTVADMSSMTPSTLEKFKNNTQARTRILIDPYKININTNEYFFAYTSIFVEKDDNQNSILKYHLTIPTASGLNDIVDVSLEAIMKRPEAQNLDLNTFTYQNLLKLDGILRSNSISHPTSIATEEFEDLEFYKFIFNKFYPDIVFEEGKTFIKTSDLTSDLKPEVAPTGNPSKDYRWATNNYALNLSADNPRAFTSLKGINHLKGVTSLTLNRRDIRAIKGEGGNWVEQITYIAGMTSLKVLDLSNTGIYDRLGDSNKMPKGKSNKFIIKLNALTNLEYLFLNNNSGVMPLNQIYSFDGVQKFTKLKLLDVTGNTFTVEKDTSGSFWADINNLIKSVFQNIVNNMYGSNGSTNRPYFAVLGISCDVINGGGAIELNENTYLIVSALSSLEYINKIKVNEDIGVAYSEYNYTDLETKRKIFGLNNKYSEELKDGKGNNSVKLNYRLQSIEFIPDNKDPKLATGFDFKIVYNGGYQRWIDMGLFGVWGSETAFESPIEYTFYYEVERVS